jgi:hypothetical protein
MKAFISGCDEIGIVTPTAVGSSMSVILNVFVLTKKKNRNTPGGFISKPVCYDKYVTIHCRSNRG